MTSRGPFRPKTFYDSVILNGTFKSSSLRESHSLAVVINTVIKISATQGLMSSCHLAFQENTQLSRKVF